MLNLNLKNRLCTFGFHQTLSDFYPVKKNWAANPYLHYLLQETSA